MKNEFVCTIDNSKFSSEEALAQHMIINYSLTQKRGDDTSNIFKKVQDAFPTGIIDLTKRNDEGEEGIHICMRIKDCGADFEFIISETSKDRYYGEIAFENVESAINHYSELLSEKDKLVSEIKNKFNADKVEVHQVYDAPGYTDDDVSSITFSFYIKEKEYMGSYGFEGIDACIRSLEGYFIDSLEGKVFVDYGRYDSTNTIYIDGINIKDLAIRAKTMKIQILESR